MDWRQTALNWVNSLKLNEDKELQKIEDLRDGYFFGQVLELLFKRGKGIALDRVYRMLQNVLTDLYLPADWINFELAQVGDPNELEKIVSVIIGTHLVQEGASHFTVLPSETLSRPCQVRIKDFILYVMKHGNIVTSDALQFIRTYEINESGTTRTSTIAPRVLFPSIPEDCEQEDHFGDKENENFQSPLQALNETFSFPKIRSSAVLTSKRLLSASRNEVTVLRRKVFVLEKCNQDLEELVEEERESRRKTEVELDKERENHKKTKQKLENAVSQQEMNEQQLSVLLTEQTNLKTELSIAKSRLVATRNESSATNRITAELEQKIRDLETQLTLLKHKLATAQNAASTLDAEKEELETLLHKTSDELGWTQAELKSLESRLKVSEDVAQSVHEELRAALASNESLKRMLESRIKMLETADHNLSKAKEAESTAKLSLLRAQEDLASAKTENETLKGHFQHVADQLTAELIEGTELLVQKKDLERGIELLEEKISAIENQAASDIRVLEAQLSKNQQEMHGLGLQLAESQRFSDSLKFLKEKEVAELEAALKKSIEQAKECRVREEQLKQSISDLEAIQLRSVQEIAELQTENAVLKAEVEATEAKTRETTKAQLQKTYTASFEEAKKHLISVYRREMEAIQEEIEKHKREKILLRANVVELSNKVCALEQASREKDLKLAKLEEKIKELQQQSAAEIAAAEESLNRRLSIQSTGSGRMKVVPNGSGSLFPCDDEEEFPFNESNFEEQMKPRRGGNDIPQFQLDDKRISELQRRNSLVPPHLRSVYSVEYSTLGSEVGLNEEQFRAPSELARSLIKSVSAPITASMNSATTQKPHLINVTKEQLPGPTPKKSASVASATRAPLSPSTFNVKCRMRSQPPPKTSQTKTNSVRGSSITQPKTSTPRGGFLRNLKFD